MLAIRLKRVGRKGQPMYRLIVQESQRHPSSGRVVKYLGSHNPHTKETNLDKEQIKFYLENGAQPSDRAVRLISGEGIELPSWVSERTKQERTIRSPEKLRKNQPKEEVPAEEPAAAEADSSEESTADEVTDAKDEAVEAKAEEPAADVAKAEESTEDEPAEEPAKAEEEPATEPADSEKPAEEPKADKAEAESSDEAKDGADDEKAAA